MIRIDFEGQAGSKWYLELPSEINVVEAAEIMIKASSAWAGYDMLDKFKAAIEQIEEERL